MTTQTGLRTTIKTGPLVEAPDLAINLNGHFALNLPQVTIKLLLPGGSLTIRGKLPSQH